MGTSTSFNTQEILNFILNCLTIVCSCIVCLILGWGMLKHPKLVNRISLRLTFGIALVDIIKAICIILYSLDIKPGLECVIISFLLHWLTLVYILINTIILFNVFIIFVSEYNGTINLEMYYWITSFLFPALILFPALVRDKFGYDLKRNICEYKDITDYETVLYNRVGFLGWLFIFNIAAIYMLTGIVSKLLHRQKTFLDLAFHFNLRKLVIRITLQCFIPIITQIPLAIDYILLEFGINSFTARMFSTVSTDIPGILNLILFTFDPVCKTLWDTWYQPTELTPPTTLSDQTISIDLSNHPLSPEFSINYLAPSGTTHFYNHSHTSIISDHLEPSYITKTIKKL